MKITIIGASGHGKVVAEIASLCGYDQIEFLDDNESLSNCGDWPIVGKSIKAIEIENDLFIAIGNSSIRRKLTEKLKNKTFVTLVHPSAVVSKNSIIGPGTVIMAGACINPDAIIGAGCIINTCSSIDHDCKIGDYSHISVGSHLCGTVIVGEDSWIGAGSTIINNISITSGCLIGAGAVVVNDINERGTYIGVPAKLKR